jgi:ribosomal protein L37E
MMEDAGQAHQGNGIQACYGLPGSITCPCCGRTSHNIHDVADGYCGFCHDWTAEWTPEQIARRQAERRG